MEAQHNSRHDSVKANAVLVSSLEYDAKIRAALGLNLNATLIDCIEDCEQVLGASTKELKILFKGNYIYVTITP